MKTIDYLLVGQGIAGSVLSYTLMQRGHRVLVIDREAATSASKIASGICNPITGRHLSKTWQADALFPYLHQFYRAWEQTLQASFFRPLPVYRPFLSIEAQNEWYARSSDSKWTDYVELQPNDAHYAPFTHNPLGGWATKGSAWVNVPLLLALHRDWLVARGAYQAADLGWHELDISADRIVWNNITAQRVIWCEGWEAVQNPWFAHLPFAPNRGEWLQIAIPAAPYQLQGVLNKGIFILPLPDGTYQVGSTYDREALHHHATQAARLELSQKLEGILRLPYEILDQRAAVRPATAPRRPFVGLHPKQPLVGIFNGLGTKGVSLAPYFAAHFANYLEKNPDFDLEKEINIQKFVSY